MQCNYQKNEQTQIFKLSGKLDQDSYSQFEQDIHESYTPGLDVVLDVCQLDYIRVLSQSHKFNYNLI